MTAEPTVATDAVEWFRWVMGGAATVLLGAGSVLYKRTDSLGKRIDEAKREVTNAVERLGDKINEHELDDERQFAKKDDLRRAFDLLSTDLKDIKSNQDRGLGAILQRLEKLGRD